MNIQFTTIDAQNHVRNFSWWLPNMETTFDVLSSLCLKGQWLVKAVLIDGTHRTILPLEAFDGIAISPALQSLEEEWKLLLNQEFY